MAYPKNAYVAVYGVGGVGRCFLQQLEALARRIAPSCQLHLVLVARSSKALAATPPGPNCASLSFQTWAKDLDECTHGPMTADNLLTYLRSFPVHSVTLVDNTSNQALAEAYPDLLEHGVHIVTPNKKAFSGSTALWDRLFPAAPRPGRGSIYHESTVGAGLPVISTLKDLIETGDEVGRIEGVFSGTMSFLFNNFAPVAGGGGRFSAEVQKARDLGYTEPDPRDDMNGLDVARKLTILARLLGLPVASATSFPVRSLIPPALETVAGPDEFLARLPDFDDEMDRLKREAAAESKVLRYVGSIDVASRDVRVGLEKLSTSHPIAQLAGSDNLICFHTKRYGDRPLIIQGAGAGAEVTAMGVLGDVIKVLQLRQAD
ncbi:MAG: hypothetical protein M1826_002880 [Phylliscum demangeonii]|nr:MAG: hypothetical protein M1826_002880 [Phylliscum demangeonii]